jgi:hypothetical protein
MLLVLAVPGVASAMPHGGTFSARYIDGANVIVLNYNAAEDLKTGTSITHNLRVYDLTGQPILFESVQLELKRGNSVVHTQTMNISANNDVNLVYSYPHTGSYTLAARFIDHGKQISEASFPLVVGKGAGIGLFTDILTLPVAIAFLRGLAAANRFAHRRTHKLPATFAKLMPKLRKKA